MNEYTWKKFLEVAIATLGEGEMRVENTKSFCAWTTFRSLETDCHYWQAGLPKLNDLDDTGHKDWGVWRQPFYYNELAHIIIPKTFVAGLVGEKQTQNIAELSENLKQEGLEHNCSDIILEVKLY